MPGFAGAWFFLVASAGRTLRETEGSERRVLLERSGVSRDGWSARRHEDLLAAQRLGAGVFPVPLLIAR